MTTRKRQAPTIHLISGLPCSGKTTYATGLRTDLDCSLFSLDRWLITSFGTYAINSIGHEEHTRRVLACRELIWDCAAELLRRSVDVILDDGFFLREHRARYVERAAAVGAKARIHFIDTPVEVVRSRLVQRNSKLPRFNFHIDPETLRGFEALFEAPSDTEGADVVVVKTFGRAEGYERGKAITPAGQSMKLSIVEEGGVRVVEGEPDRPFMSRVDDANRVLEACFSGRVRCALLYAGNLTAGFFDLSSGEAGAILQKLRNYEVRLAVVCPAGSVPFSTRFGEMVAEERLRQHFGIFETRETAREWLGQAP